jgi:hypothetical protein
MEYRKVLGIVLSLLCFDLIAEEECACYDQRKTTTACHTKPGKITQQKPQEHGANDTEVAKMAISALASMATNLVNIGTDPHNPQVVGTNVINMLSSFVNFVTFALKNPQLVELLDDELFQESLRNYVVKSLTEKPLVEYEDMAKDVE